MRAVITVNAIRPRSRTAVFCHEPAAQTGPIDYATESIVTPSDARPLDDTAARLIDALNQDEFVLHQQPIVPLRAAPQPAASEEGYQEIYVRFQEEEEKLLPPGTFIPVLESYALMHLLDRWVVNRVIKWMHAGRRHDAHWVAPCCSINLSNDSLVNPDTARFVAQQIQRGGIDGRKLGFEIAEDDARTYQPPLSALIRELRPLGCRFTLTSYTGNDVPPDSLAGLGIDGIKLDIEIVTRLHCDPASVRHARDIKNVCGSTGVLTIAEFVERQDTVEHLLGLRIDYAQGFGIGHSKPLYTAALAKMEPRQLRRAAA